MNFYFKRNFIFVVILFSKELYEYDTNYLCIFSNLIDYFNFIFTNMPSL